MCAVSGTEGVVDVAVGIACESLYKLLLGGLYCCLCGFLLLICCILCQAAGFTFFLCVVAEVFKEEDLTGLQGVGLSLCLLAVRSKLYGNAQAF